ncbi:YybS family protein [Bacillus sp. 165]|uniref:YybS family protein n=1 Tax=Bacillus sp. 165 TaxID=1529117 RepID=UPI001AD95646|nr:YybS family protein [Bacillus sp. 165]MBO9131350.1 YybS family protein [Bacillus sp. 165]
MKNTRMITEGAVLLAIFSLLLLITLYIPFIGTILMFALPLPFILYTMRFGSKYALLLLLAACVITMLISSIFTIALSLTFGLSGIVIGTFYQQGRKKWETLLAGTVIYIVSIVIFYSITVKFLESNLIVNLQDMLLGAISQTEQIAKSTGMDINQENLQKLKGSVKIIPYIIPTLLVITAFMYALFTDLMAVPVLKRLNYKVQPWAPFRLFQLPKNILWYYIIVLICVMFIQVEKGSYLYLVLLNLSYIFSTLMTVQGFAFISFFAHKKGYGKAIPLFLFVFGLFIPNLFYIISFLGIIDLGFSLRQKVDKT